MVTWMTDKVDKLPNLTQKLTRRLLDAFADNMSPERAIDIVERVIYPAILTERQRAGRLQAKIDRITRIVNDDPEPDLKPKPKPKPKISQACELPTGDECGS